ncbi:hypothetical protein VroAM7_02450 [Vibrio rotiferianus]|uniref:Uncharacterized protein n=1 Tax=Vibrio rotiferianus TaxID=190895 RepID=A0A510I1Y5_9VIBR|nr:hypothetical protein [Vibrio rotiferianus]BBL87592.1 hypothetical protein VroAM7_02450 [Vibrio rotiferianus]
MSCENVSLSLVENPINYINTIEFASQEGISTQAIILVIVSKNTENISQLKRMINEDEWSDVVYCFNDCNVNLFSYVRLFLKFKKELSNFKLDYLISGYYEHKVNVYLYQICNYNRFILVDDGNMTIFTNDLRHHTKSISPLSISKRLVSKLGMLIVAMFVGYKKVYLDKVTYFTSKNLSVSNGDDVIQNNYLNIKKNTLSKSIERDVCFFLGAPLSDISITSLESEYDIIESAMSFLKSRYSRVFYFPHRFEDTKKIECVLDRYDVVVVDTQLPFELYLSSLSSSIPSCIAGFYTSTFSNLSYLATERQIMLNALVIPSQLILNLKKSKLIESIYEKYSDDDSITLSTIL